MIAMLWTGIVLKFKDQAAGNYRDAVLNTQNLALLFEENILRTVGEVDKALYFMRRQIGQHPDSADPHRIVSNSDVFNDLIVQFAIVDATGTLKASSAGGHPTAPIDLSDREYFPFHRDNSKDELHVSRPMVGRVSKKWSIQLTRRFLDKDGAFGGVVVGSLNPDHSHRFLPVDRSRPERVDFADRLGRRRACVRRHQRPRPLGTRPGRSRLATSE